MVLSGQKLSMWVRDYATGQAEKEREHHKVAQKEFSQLPSLDLFKYF